MATYITIHGATIQVLSADPSNPVEGQIWYNTTTGTIRGKNNSGVVTVTAS
tara:strand:- start:2 stop:154 length:153 start_codon:yes stop_codon:yes gene_type:complete